MLVEGLDLVSNKALRITVDRGRIARMEEISRTAGLPYLCSGFLDIQVNGYQIGRASCRERV